MKVRIILFPSLSSLLPPLNSQHPCTTSPKRNYGGFLFGWNGNFLAWHSKLITSSMFSILSPMVLFVHFLSGPQDAWPPAQLSFHTSAPCSGCSQDALPPIQSTWQTLSIPQDPAEMLPVSICLCILFRTVYLPHLSSHTWPFKWQHYSHCAIANAHILPTAATLCSKDDAFHCVCCLSIWYIVNTQWKLVKVSKTMCSCVTRRDMLWFGFKYLLSFYPLRSIWRIQKKRNQKGGNEIDP